MLPTASFAQHAANDWQIASLQLRHRGHCESPYSQLHPPTTVCHACFEVMVKLHSCTGRGRRSALQASVRVSLMSRPTTSSQAIQSKTQSKCHQTFTNVCAVVQVEDVRWCGIQSLGLAAGLVRPVLAGCVLLLGSAELQNNAEHQFFALLSPK